MNRTVNTPEQYITAIPDHQREAISRLREMMNRLLPPGYEESILYGMITWSVALSVYPKGYGPSGGQPLPFVSLAAQKNHIAFYHMGLYSIPELHEWFVTSWRKISEKKPDMGKSCLRFRKTDDIPWMLMEELAGKISPEVWAATYDKMRRK